MRALIMFSIFSLFTSSALAALQVSDAKIVRPGGHAWPTCASDVHVNRTSWHAEALDVNALSNEKIQVTFKAVFLRCEKQTSGDVKFAWVPGNPLEVRTKTNYKGDVFKQWHEKMDFWMVDQDIKKLFETKITQVGSEITFTEEFALVDLLSESDMTDYNSGLEVRTWMGTFPRSVSMIQQDGKEPMPNGLKSWGRYNLVFTLKSTN